MNLAFKITTRDMRPPLATDSTIVYKKDKWYTHNGELVLCRSGFHFLSPRQIKQWYLPKIKGNPKLDDDILWMIEFSDDAIHDNQKSVASSIRLIEEVSDKFEGHGPRSWARIGDSIIHEYLDKNDKQ